MIMQPVGLITNCILNIYGYFVTESITFVCAGLSIGHGVYFATQSSYSINGYSPADANGLKYIYQARVLSGKIGSGQGGIKEPPAGFDSVGNAQMVVIFYDAQAYPEYLITFK